MDKRMDMPNTELSVFPMGLGTVDAGLKWDGRDADRIFDTYLDRGGNLIDTAHVYSDWVKPEVARSERVVGDWLARGGKRDRVVLMTKGGHPDMACEHPDASKSRMARADMRQDLDASLKKLRTDRIDIYFYHRDDERIPVGELIDVMEGFRSAGKIRYYGCSNWTTARMREADAYCQKAGYRGFVANQALLNYGAKHMRPFPDPTMKRMDTGMCAYHANNSGNLAMPYMGVASGFFHTLLARGVEAVSASPYNTEGNMIAFERLRVLMDKNSATVTQVLLGYFTSLPFACVPLYGPESPVQLLEAMDTYSLTFDAKDFEG